MERRATLQNAGAVDPNMRRLARPEEYGLPYDYTQELHGGDKEDIEALVDTIEEIADRGGRDESIL